MRLQTKAASWGSAAQTRWGAVREQAASQSCAYLATFCVRNNSKDVSPANVKEGALRCLEVLLFQCLHTLEHGPVLSSVSDDHDNATTTTFEPLQQGWSKRIKTRLEVRFLDSFSVCLFVC